MTFMDEFGIDSILVWQAHTGEVSGYQVVDCVKTDAVDLYGRVWILRRGSVKNNKWTPRPKDQGFTTISLTTEELRAYGFERVWTPQGEFQDGEFLVDSGGHVFYHENKETVWRLGEGDVSHAPLGMRVKQFGELAILRTASLRKFSEVVK